MINLIHEIYIGLLAQLSNNTMLVAGIGTILAGAALALLRNVPLHIFHAIKQVSTLTLTLHTKNAKYYEVADFLNGIRINATSRNFSLSRRYNDEIKNILGYKTKKRQLPSNVILGYGTSFAIYKGTILIINKSTLANKNDIDDQLTITFLTRNKEVLIDFLEDAFKKDNTNVDIYVSDSDYWKEPVQRSKRQLETIFINDEIKENIIKAITEFQQNKDWYVNRGIPYKLCIVFHGKPGTGKTSLIHAIASKFDMGIRYISELENISSLCTEVSSSKELVVIEDIDSLANLNRDTESSTVSSKKIIHNLLNVLDGLKTPEGLMIILTTNHINALDEALKRAGRVDYMIELPPLNQEAMKKMYISFYGEEHKDVLDKFLECGTYKDRTGAELQELFLEHDAVNVLTHLE